MQQTASVPDHLRHELLEIMRGITGLNAELSARTNFDEIGLQSLAVVAFTRQIETSFPKLPQTFLYDCRNIDEVAEYLMKRFPKEAGAFGQRHQPQLSEPLNDPDVVWPEFKDLPTSNKGEVTTEIAIIGMAGRFPGADTIAAFWTNLQRGIDSVREIPSGRWDVEGFFEPRGEGQRHEARSYSKWGGFLEDVDKFDAQFFGIASREAALADPQERIFLETAWHALENAGLLGCRARSIKSENGLDIGVFAGITTNTYLLHGPERWRQHNSDIPTSMPWSAANRVSYFLDCCGPSLTVDTACSSSLTAIHLACASIVRGECTAALAGGANLYLHPAKYIQLCQQQMLSPTGHCHSFGASADGFTPGEGVGVVVLKTLARALADGDQVHAIIKGSATNHNGRTNGYTVPKASAQASLVKQALKNAGLPPSSIGCIEAHGTGTKLGDPIEVEGLIEALATEGLGPDCAIGSVKSNIGHLESAAGVASLIKIVLQLKHRTIVPSLYSETLNPALRLENTRFFVPQVLGPWPSEELRCAGVSSFGAGGTNAHVIVQEVESDTERIVHHGPSVFVFSARSADRLRAVAQQMHHFLVEGTSEEDLAQIAFTLQCARRHFEHRLAIVAHDARSLISSLDQFLETSDDPSARGTAAFFTGRIDAETSFSASSNRDEAELAASWCRGEFIDWLAQWSAPPQPAELPNYPFARDTHWISPLTKVSSELKINSYTVSGQSSLIADHRINGEALLPGTAFIACAYSDVSDLGSGDAVEFFEMRWVRPIVSEGGKDATFVCRVDPSGPITIESNAPESKVCFRSGFRKTKTSLEPLVTLEEAVARCAQTADVAACYDNFERAEMRYGPRFRCLDKAWIGNGEALGLVRRRINPGMGESSWLIDPALMDGALHTACVLLCGDTLFESPLVPVSAGRVRLLKPLCDSLFVYVRQRRLEGATERRFDVVIFSSDGAVLVEIEDIRFQKIALRAANPAAPLHYFQWRWDLEDERKLEHSPGPAILFDKDPELADTLKRLCSHTLELRLTLPDSSFRVEGNATYTWDPTSAPHAALLWRTLSAENVRPRTLIFRVDCDGAEGKPLAPSALANVEMLRTLLKACPAPRFHLVFAITGEEDRLKPEASAIAGLLRCLRLEIPDVTASVLEISGNDIQSAATAIAIELSASTEAGVREIRWEKGKSRRRRLVPAKFSGGNERAWPKFSENDVCVITGGGGAVGRSLACVLAKRGVKHLALVSRSPFEDAADGFLGNVARHGAQATHYVADCADAKQLNRALESIVREMGVPTVIVHCAGILRDGFFTRQEGEDLSEACRAKVAGAYNLDRLTRAFPIRSFIICSALAGIAGNVGQSHYAFANCWIDRFAEWRQHLVDDGQRNGITRSIAWPLWDTADGMKASPQLLRTLNERGIRAISKSDADEIVSRAFASETPTLITGKGDRAALTDLLGVAQAKRAETGGAKGELPAASPKDQTDIVEIVREALSRVTETPLAKIDPDASMEVFGLDSIMVTELNAILEKNYPRLAKTAIFEARTIRSLASLIRSEYSDELQLIEAMAVGVEPPDTANRPPFLTAESNAPIRTGDIAIIGLAGKYPGADTLEEFWRRLREGADLVTELPARWPERLADDERIYARWGSFLDDFDKFDPLFFGISPRDAERMDPQERLFLQTAWHAVENAGYAPDRLSRGGDGGHRRVGVIVGVMYGEYQFYGASAAADADGPLTNSSYASIANRVSFCLDLDGPSFAVDSMCSSSLHAIHLACDFIRSGTCELAIAGGVNLSLHPYKYVTLCELGFAATDGKCHSFGQGGDGYVPGEGVGAVLLKSLADAVRDGDHIHGVIRGSDIGHGGRSSGYTVPNVDAQANVIKRTLRLSDIKPADISYVEAHGTGTSLGDPIEIRGLAKAIGGEYPTGQKCPIGSIKANIGHLESAAGIAALTKVLLQMRYREIVPSIHSETLNPNINFAETPFVVQTVLAPWHVASGKTRVASISSFGAGGSNAHLLIEEYPSIVMRPSVAYGPQVFVLSARNWKQLNAASSRFREFLAEREGQMLDMAGIAATLFDGRRWNRCRCAVIAQDIGELRQKLERLASIIRDCSTGELPCEWEDGLFASEIKSAVTKRNDQQSLADQAADWVKGVRDQRFTTLVERYQKVPLPGYEFEQLSFWVTAQSEAPAESEIFSAAAPNANAHPAPETILAQVERGEMSLAEAQQILERILEAESSASLVE